MPEVSCRPTTAASEVWTATASAAGAAPAPTFSVLPVSSSVSAGAAVSAAAPSLSSTSSSTRRAEVALPDIDAAIAEVTRQDNADPKRVGEYVNAIMKHHFEQEVS
jgi:hypothetical protein